MSTDEKIDKLLTGMTRIEVITNQHTEDLKDLQAQLEPVIYHVNGVKWLMKLGAGTLAVVTAVAGILLALK